MRAEPSAPAPRADTAGGRERQTATGGTHSPPAGAAAATPARDGAAVGAARGSRVRTARGPDRSAGHNTERQMPPFYVEMENAAGARSAGRQTGRGRSGRSCTRPRGPRPTAGTQAAGDLGTATDRLTWLARRTLRLITVWGFAGSQLPDRARHVQNTEITGVRGVRSGRDDGGAMGRSPATA